MTIGNSARCIAVGHFFVHLAKLKQKAFAQVRSKNTGRFKMLETMQYRQYFVEFNFRILQSVQNFFGSLGEAAIGIHSIDKCSCDHMVCDGKTGEIQLPMQLVVQRFRFGVPICKLSHFTVGG